MNTPAVRSRTFRYIWLSLAAIAVGALVLPGASGWGSIVPPPPSDTNAPSDPEPSPSPSAPAEVSERVFWSSALSREMPYTVYLPAGYDSATQARYPVLYMLHGLGGDHLIEWRAYGLFDQAETLTRVGKIEPGLCP